MTTLLDSPPAPESAAAIRGQLDEMRTKAADAERAQASIRAERAAAAAIGDHATVSRLRQALEVHAEDAVLYRDAVPLLEQQLAEAEAREKTQARDTARAEMEQAAAAEATAAAHAKALIRDAVPALRAAFAAAQQAAERTNRARDTHTRLQHGGKRPPASFGGAGWHVSHDVPAALSTLAQYAEGT